MKTTGSVRYLCSKCEGPMGLGSYYIEGKAVCYSCFESEKQEHGIAIDKLNDRAKNLVTSLCELRQLRMLLYKREASLRNYLDMVSVSIGKELEEILRSLK